MAVGIPRRSYFSIKMFYAFLIVFFGIVIYQLVSFYQKDKEDSPLLINEPKNGKQALTISKDRIKLPEVGNDMSFSFWIYINDWSYLLGRTKHIFHIGDQAMTKICPGLWLYPTDTNLMVRIDTYENVNEVNYNTRQGQSFDQTKSCPLQSSTDQKACKELCTKDEKCSGYVEFDTTENDKCRTYKTSQNPMNILVANNKATAFPKLRTKNPLFYNDPSNFQITKQCDVAEIQLQSWAHVAVVVSENTLRVYINGKLARNCELSSMPKMNEGDLYINLDGGFDGLLSQFRYHKKALTEEDVRRLYSVSHIADPRVLMANLSVSEYIPSCRLGSDTTSPNAVSEPTGGSTV